MPEYTLTYSPQYLYVLSGKHTCIAVYFFFYICMLPETDEFSDRKHQTSFFIMAGPLRTVLPIHSDKTICLDQGRMMKQIRLITRSQYHLSDHHPYTFCIRARHICIYISKEIDDQKPIHFRLHFKMKKSVRLKNNWHIYSTRYSPSFLLNLHVHTAKLKTTLLIAYSWLETVRFRVNKTEGKAPELRSHLSIFSSLLLRSDPRSLEIDRSNLLPALARLAGRPGSLYVYLYIYAADGQLATGVGSVLRVVSVEPLLASARQVSCAVVCHTTTPTDRIFLFFERERERDKVKQQSASDVMISI